MSVNRYIFNFSCRLKNLKFCPTASALNMTSESRRKGMSQQRLVKHCDLYSRCDGDEVPNMDSYIIQDFMYLMSGRGSGRREASAMLECDR